MTHESTRLGTVAPNKNDSSTMHFTVYANMESIHKIMMKLMTVALRSEGKCGRGKFRKTME